MPGNNIFVQILKMSSPVWVSQCGFISKFNYVREHPSTLCDPRFQQELVHTLILGAQFYVVCLIALAFVRDDVSTCCAG